MEICNEIMQTLKNANNEFTDSPYWLILDPEQNLSRDIDLLAGQITGPFFSREDAQSFLNKTRYNFSNRAKVYCLSGAKSAKYSDFFKKLKI